MAAFLNKRSLLRSLSRVVLVRTTLIGLGMVLTASSACTVEEVGGWFCVAGTVAVAEVFDDYHDHYYYYDDPCWDDGDYYYEEASDESDKANNLMVSGSGEVITVGYDTLNFSAKLNYGSGLYFFAPDPEGKITGDKIICAASVNGDKIAGDCFRTGHVCHFEYLRDNSADVEGKDAYAPSSSTCKEGGEVGPFLVPLDSPICGQDPFPACPADDLFPTGPAASSLESQPTTPDDDVDNLQN